MKLRIRGRNLRRVSRGLRFRLTATYAILFLLVLVFVATGFRQYLKSTLDSQTNEDLDDEWLGVKGGYLRIYLDREKNQYFTDWYYDENDPDETTLVGVIKKVFVVTDEFGNVLTDFKTGDRQISTEFEDIGIDKAAVRKRVGKYRANPSTLSNPDWDDRTDSDGKRFRIRGGILLETSTSPPKPFYVALGQSLTGNDEIMRKYTFAVYVGIIPGALILGSFLGWSLAGRVLNPVREVAQAAQRISGSNLSLRIPSRQADDELDYLILTFNRMIDRLETSFRQIKQFSTDVSHELRTPITGIRGQLEVALFTAKTTDQYREAMINSLQDIDRLSQIVRALLLLSQAESGQLVLQKSPVDMSELVSDVVDQFQIPAEAADVHLTAQISGPCQLDADRIQIGRLLTNLLSNAIKFTPPGGDVRVELSTSEGCVEIVVADTGRGIPSESLPHIFDRFYRVPGSGMAQDPEQGLGLGLSFVEWIVKAHCGTIEVTSTPGQGTRFAIKLPADAIRAETLELAPQSTE